MSHIREDPIRKRLKALVVDGDSQEIETSKGQDGGDPFQMALPAFLAMVWNVDRQKEVPDQDGPDAGFVITDVSPRGHPHRSPEELFIKRLTRAIFQLFWDGVPEIIASTASRHRLACPKILTFFSGPAAFLC